MFSFQLSSSRPGGDGLQYRLCGKLGHDFENAIDIEYDHELAVEAMHAAGELGHAGIEVDGVFLAAVIGELEHFADLIDQKAVGFAAQIDAYRHRRRPSSFFGRPRRARMST